EDGIRDKLVTGVQTCALPICYSREAVAFLERVRPYLKIKGAEVDLVIRFQQTFDRTLGAEDAYRIRFDFKTKLESMRNSHQSRQIGRASCRERGTSRGVVEAG